MRKRSEIIGSGSEAVQVLAFDVFGTTVDWRSGVADQVAGIAAEAGIEAGVETESKTGGVLDAGRFADDWRDRYLPSLAEVIEGRRPWVNLDALHRESLEALLDSYGVADAFDEVARRRLVRVWHRLPAWPDVTEGLARLAQRYTLTTLSNGGFALLTELVKAANLPFDCILSAENARAYKPDAAVYRIAADLLDVPPDAVLMVAAHRWDLGGAAAANLRTAFVERPTEKGPHRQADRATDVVCDLVAKNFIDLAEQLGC